MCFGVSSSPIPPHDLPINLMNFTQTIRTIQQTRDSLLCIGLDLDRTKLPSTLRTTRNGILKFGTSIIEATFDLVCAYKFNLAFFEALGSGGADILSRLVECCPRRIFTIGDGKRGDIGNTAEMYARALFEQLGFDSITVHPYMGTDSVTPFLHTPERGAFVLALTSNPGARDFQYLRAGGRPLYEHVVRRVRRWNTRRNCGLVVGATRPKELQRIRSLAPDMPILIPGIGAQGGNLRMAVRYGCSHEGTLAIINVGRSALYASGGKDFAEAARREALAIRNQINEYRMEFFHSP